MNNFFSTPYRIFICAWILIHGTIVAENAQWTWRYIDYIPSKEKSVTSYTTPIHTTEPFTQLIFSWNASRPHKGYYLFFIQGRDAKTGAWSSWHKTMEWGTKKQVSYMSPSDGIASYEHVRFEVQSGKKCNAYRIGIQAHEGASLHTMHRLCASCTDFTRFKNERVQECVSLPTVHVAYVPYRSQFALLHPEKERLCSPTSCAMLVEFLTKKHISMQPFAAKIYDQALDTYGNWTFNMAHAHTCATSHWFSVMRLNNFKELHTFLMRGIPVAVSVRGFLNGAPQEYNNGHLLVVVGYDASKKKVICHDPAFKSDHLTVHAYDLSSFLQAWERSRRLTYCIEKKDAIQKI